MEKGSEKIRYPLIRIAITGPESTGKSQLAKELAAHYHTVFVPEYAREYLDKLNREYEYHDLEIIAKGQMKAQTDAEKKANKIIFCDTDLTVIKIWSEHKFKRCPAWVLKNILQHPYDLYLLCDIDLPWKPDPLREHPHLRTYFFDWYKDELHSRNANFSIIAGQGNKRLKSAVDAVEKIFQDS